MVRPDASLQEAKAWLRQEAMNGGAKCPCCQQLAKVYRRRMTSTTARVLLRMALDHGTGWVHVPTLMKECLPDVAHQGGYATLAQHWGLLEEDGGTRGDGSTRVGTWRLTPLGLLFAGNKTTVATYAHLYDGRCLGLSGDPVGIQDVLGTRFDYLELRYG